MGGLRRTIRRARREGGGFTLVEMLVAVTMAMVVLAGAVLLFTAAVRSQLKVTSQATAIQQARAIEERFVREIRQSSGLVPGTSATSSQVSIVTYVDTDSGCTGAASSTANLCSVTYRCTGTSPSIACTRTIAKADGTSPGSPVTVVTGLTSSDVFSYSPSASAPTFIGVSLTLAARSANGTTSNAVTLTDGAALRNRTS